MDQNEEHWVIPQLLNKACNLTFDINTANEHLILSECGRQVTLTTEKQTYPDHPDRFERRGQVLCREALSGRCYWEVEWTACGVNIGVAFKNVKRKGWDAEILRSDETWLFYDYSSWGFSFQHRHQAVFLPLPFIDVKAFLARPRRLGIFLDSTAGILCFYWLSDDTRTLFHTFHSTFTEPVYPVFSI
uniref:B30.2/SPRY domain-containing protein n=1 Tax=Cyprinodon variegatus TaxID=28743 RepID=A0A3Q2E0H5_CYPVA